MNRVTVFQFSALWILRMTTGILLPLPLPNENQSINKLLCTKKEHIKISHMLNTIVENTSFYDKNSHFLICLLYEVKFSHLKISRTSLVAQWLRICLPMQGTRVLSLVWEYPTCHGATKPMCHNYWACVPQLLSPHATTTEARAPRAHAPQQEKPLQWEARAPQRRVAPAHRN